MCDPTDEKWRKERYLEKIVKKIDLDFVRCLFFLLKTLFFAKVTQ